ncbi:flagellar biosynthesis protein FlhF [Paenibacillus alkalitolerans]|uniref:flagellar biosynthesis protein FlhF n=1 Tax=Paenibacillus alkalitolerans TaxID=2799335 RepID=UPI0018F720B7|nr:flagellar biosynthesis protein FlhF [Paenibacillus alkalitolerans]
MKVKRYVVDTMPDALQKIRSELGKDAVIINTKEIRVGGILGMFSKKKIEVIAAADTFPESNQPAVPVVRLSAGPAASAGAPVARQPAEPEQRAAVSILTPPPKPSAGVKLEREPEAGQRKESMLSSVPLRMPSASSEREDALLEEMKQMKEMMRKLAGAEFMAEAEAPVPEMFDQLKQRLVEQEVRPELAQALIEAAAAGQPPDERTEADLRNRLKDELTSLLGRQPVEPIRTDTRIAHFVGPTGVGKTTTIAKLAAEQVLKFKRSVGFITSDTYRIAAVEQLRTYANILNVPLEVVFSPLDLPKAFEKLGDRDIIFMDTAGRNFRNEMYVSELNSLLRTEERRETYLVLSLSMKYKDMRAITENFSKFGLHKVLFTKADETVTFGSIVNLLYDFPISLSYITDGQNVPDDIRPADEKQLAERLLEEPRNE